MSFSVPYHSDPTEQVDAITKVVTEQLERKVGPRFAEMLHLAATTIPGLASMGWQVTAEIRKTMPSVVWEHSSLEQLQQISVEYESNSPHIIVRAHAAPHYPLNAAYLSEAQTIVTVRSSVHEPTLALNALTHNVMDAETWVSFFQDEPYAACGAVLAVPTVALPVIYEVAEKLVREQMVYFTGMVGDARCVLASRYDLPADLVVKYAQHDATNVRRIALAHPLCPYSLLEQAAQDDYVAAAHLALITSDEDVIRDSAERTEVTIRRATAQNLLASSDVLERLARDRDTQVREHVAANPSCPSEVFMFFATTEQPKSVKETASQNVSCSNRIRVLLAL